MSATPLRAPNLNKVETADKHQSAPDWQVSTWLNSEVLSLEKLRGKVIVLHAFQMLCPGCILKGIPQTQRVADTFRGAPLAVVGLHTVFEHHSAMEVRSLRAFVHEFKLEFPIGIDVPGAGSPIPQTMAAYGMRGTPTTILIDAEGKLRQHVFGVHEDMALGAAIQSLLIEANVDR
jgi:peroxiredoxin